MIRCGLSSRRELRDRLAFTLGLGVQWHETGGLSSAMSMLVSARMCC